MKDEVDKRYVKYTYSQAIWNDDDLHPEIKDKIFEDHQLDRPEATVYGPSDDNPVAGSPLTNEEIEYELFGNEDIREMRISRPPLAYYFGKSKS